MSNWRFLLHFKGHLALFYSRNSTWSFLSRIKQASNELAFSFFVNSTSHNHSTTLTEAGNGVFHPTEHSYAKKKNRKFWTWRYSFLIDRMVTYHRSKVCQVRINFKLNPIVYEYILNRGWVGVYFHCSHLFRSAVIWNGSQTLFHEIINLK